MPASFHALRDRAAAQVDRVFAEEVQIVFLDGGAVDGGRAGVTIRAPLRTGEAMQRSIAGGDARDWNTRVAGAAGLLSVDRTAWPMLPAIRKGDKVRAVERPGRPWFEVSIVDDRDHRRLHVYLVQA